MPAVADMQNGIIREFEDNPDVVAVIFNQGGANGETLSWLRTVWDNFYLRAKIIWDETGTTGKNTYAQPNTGLPFGRWFVIDRNGYIAAAEFGYDPAKAIRIIYSLLNKPTTSACHQLADGTEVGMLGKMVTAGTSQIGGAFYVENPDRSGGIRVEWPAGTSVPQWVSADVAGRLATADTGERKIDAFSVTQYSGSSLAALALPNFVLGGASPGSYTSGVTGASGLYNIGLLVTSWGRVTEVGAGCFWMDDGSGITADTGHLGVRVVTGGLAMPPGFGLDAYVMATGISSCAKLPDGTIVRAILGRASSDIAVAQSAP